MAGYMSALAFKTTYLYNAGRNYFSPQSWPWYNRIDENLILGAIPTNSMITDLKNENVAGIVCCTEDFEIKSGYFDIVEPNTWRENGIEFYHLPMQDFFGTAPLNELNDAVNFIDRITSTGKTCYVHCKAGRTRSATLAACYMIKKKDYLPNVAVEMLKRIRPTVHLRTMHWRSVNEFRRHLDELKQTRNLTQNGKI